MAEKNTDFFKKKRDWSVVKDDLLAAYLMPYVQKILRTNKPLVYVDCFSGKGKFDDGKDGSPIIALNIFNKCLAKSSMKNCNIQPKFIELDYCDDLKKNITRFKGAEAISGRYEEQIEHLLQNKTDCNIFLYVDPYGIKSLKFSLFNDFSSKYNFFSIEILMNFNTFGFLREAFRVLGLPIDEFSIYDDLVEYESTKLQVNEKSIDYLNEIAGGEYWQDIVKARNRKDMTTHKAEVEFTKLYCEKLKEHFKYVLNMPIRIKKGQIPKYRMIHATNHVDGCLLMVNNICNRWELMQHIQSAGQLGLFEEDYNNDHVNFEEIETKVLSHLKKQKNDARLKTLLSDFFMQHGPICKISDITSIYKKLEKNNNILVRRFPVFTETGKPSSFFSEDKNQSVLIKWNE